MEYEEAVQILNLNPDDVTFESARRHYRKLAQRFHPDKAETGDPSEFIRINAALEVVRATLQAPNLDSSANLEELRAELKERTDGINSAFDRAIDDLTKYKDAAFARMVEALGNQLNSHSSHDSLYEKFPVEFATTVQLQISGIVDHFRESVSSLSQEYDDWLQGILRSTYQELANNELRGFHRSPVLRVNVLSAVIASGLVVTATAYFDLPKALYFFPILAIIAAVVLYWWSVRSAFSLRNFFVPLEEYKLQVDPKHFDVHIGHRKQKAENAEVAGMGLVLGAVVGGPLGAAVGAGLGALLNSLSEGERVHELRNRFAAQASAKLKKIDSQFVELINQQLPVIREKLITAISDNYVKNKRTATLLLAYQNPNSGEAHADAPQAKSVPEPKTTLVYLWITMTILATAVYFVAVSVCPQ